MDMIVPTALKTLSIAGSAIKELTTLWKKAKGDSRAVIGEINDNLSFLNMIADQGVEIDEVIDLISMSEYKRLSAKGFNFNTLKKGKIKQLRHLEGNNLSSWNGKKTEDLIKSIYDKINYLKIHYPFLKKKNKKYRWNIRVNNIRRRIWLLLKHIHS